MSPKLTTHNSAIAGGGVFAREDITEGEVLVRWGGGLYSTAQINNGETNDQTACQIGEDLYIADPPGTELKDSDLMNHSCEPNAWMADEVTIIAKRDIVVGEEVTADYVLWVADPGYVTIAECRCGSTLCRGRITGDDWRIAELQERYKGHWPPYLQYRINKKSLV